MELSLKKLFVVCATVAFIWLVGVAAAACTYSGYEEDQARLDCVKHGQSANDCHILIH